MLALKQWEEENLLLQGGAWVMVPVGMMAPPEDSWKARGLDEDHVKDLAQQKQQSSHHQSVSRRFIQDARDAGRCTCSGAAKRGEGRKD